MESFLKIFGKGVLYTVLSPLILVAWVLYGVYLLFVFVFMFFKTTIEFFMGKNTEEFKEDLEARQMLLEDEKNQDRNQKIADAVMVGMAASMGQAVGQQMMGQNPQPNPQFGFAPNPQPISQQPPVDAIPQQPAEQIPQQPIDNNGGESK